MYVVYVSVFLLGQRSAAIPAVLLKCRQKCIQEAGQLVQKSQAAGREVAWLRSTVTQQQKIIEVYGQ